MILKPKYAIVEWESYGRFVPVVVAIGPLWKLLLDLGEWHDDPPDFMKAWKKYCTGFFCYRGAKVERWHAGSRYKTTRQIVKIGKDSEEYKILKHLHLYAVTK